VIGGSNDDNVNHSGDLSRLRITKSFDGNIDEVAFYGVALTPQQIAETRQRGAMGVIAPQDQADTLVDIETIEIAHQTPAFTASADTDASDNVQIGERLEGWPDPAQLIASAKHHGLRELIGELREQGLKLFGHTSCKPALFSVDGVALGEDGRVRHAGHEDDASREHGLAGWTRDEDAGERHSEAPAKKADAKLIDWNDTCHGLGAGMASIQQGKRGAQQGNLTEFDHPQKADKKTRR
jgi:hypothetical protein